MTFKFNKQKIPNIKPTKVWYGVYLISFIILGILIQFLIHAIIEIWYIGLLVRDFQKYSLGFSWNQWYIIHHIGTVTLLIIGLLFGYWQGKFWWQKIYEKRSNNIKTNH